MPNSRKKERRRAVPLLPETRRYDLARDDIEVRSAENGDGPIFTIAGQATHLSSYLVRDAIGEFEEVMVPGVAAEVIARGVDTRLLVGHDHGSLPLARTASNTMRLINSPTGLRFEADLDARSQLANDVSIALSRRDVTGLSVGFVSGRDSWSEDMTKRTVESFSDLPEISIVAFPAQPASSVAIREAMHAALPVESRARLRKLYANARQGKLSDEEVVLFRSILYADSGASRSVTGRESLRISDPVAMARHAVARSRNQRRQALLEDVARTRRARPSA